MKSYDILLFDLDGTLTDPSEGITNSVMHALRRMGVEPPERRALYKFIGPPLMDSFMQEYGFSQEEARQAISWYREYFQDKGIFENVPYPGIQGALQSLQSAGKRLVVATSKPEEFARRILAHFDLLGAFEFVAGASMDETRTRKHEVIAYALEACGVGDKSGVIMVGDREHDVLGARHEGLDCLGVLYGFGSREELLSAGAIALAETVGTWAGCSAANPRKIARRNGYGCDVQYHCLTQTTRPSPRSWISPRPRRPRSPSGSCWTRRGSALAARRWSGCCSRTRTR